MRQTTLQVNSKFSYGLGQWGWAAKDSCFQFFLFFYYTHLLGLSPFLAGLAALLALVVDAITDPMVGHLSDSYSNKKWGRRHPFMVAALLPFFIAFLCVFYPPQDLQQEGLFVWYLLSSIAVRVSLTVFSVPHMALGAELTSDYNERTSVVVYRSSLAYIGGIAIQLVAWFVFIPMAAKKGVAIEGFQHIGVLGATMGLVGMLVAIWGTRQHIPHLTKISQQQEQQSWHFAFSNLLSLLKFTSVRSLLLGCLCVSIAGGISNSLLIYINTLFYGFKSTQVGVFMLCVLLSLIPAAWISLKASRHFGKSKSLMVFLLVSACLGPVPVVAHLLGVTPANGSESLLLMICLFVILQQTFFIAHINCFASIVPDIADEMAVTSSMRQEGLLNSAIMLIQKMSFGVGTFVAGIVVELARVPDYGNMQLLPEYALPTLAGVYALASFLLPVIAVIFYSRYRANYAHHLDVRKTLDDAT